MKKLLHKSLKSYGIFSFLVLLISAPVYYFVIDGIWLDELDEHNEIIAERIEKKMNGLVISEEDFDSSIGLWNKVQPGSELIELSEKKNG